jgi:hypothetical protein
MAAPFEMGDHGRVQARLDLHRGAVAEEPRRVDGALQIKPVLEQLDQQIRVAGRLILPAHDAERHQRPPVLHHQARDDRVHRTLAGSERVRMFRIQPEARAAVVQHHPALGGEDRRAEGIEERVDEGDHKPVAIDGGEADRVGLGDKHALRRGGAGRRRVEPVPDLRDRAGREEFFHRGRHRGRIGEDAVAQRVGRAAHLREKVRALARVRFPLEGRPAVEDLQHEERGRALPIRGAFEHLDAVEAG